LRHTQALIDTINAGAFPPVEISTCHEELRRSGLVPG
jgi:hypothetical protein